jgi:hypothetical protein
LGDESGGLAAHELQSDLGHALSQVARSGEVGFRRRRIGAFVGIRLRAGAEPETKAVQFILRSFARVIRRRQSEADPVHAVLRGKKDKLNQCR